MTKVKHKRRQQDACRKNRVVETEADAATLTRTSVITSEFLSARLKVSVIWPRILRSQGKGPAYKILNPEAPKNKHIVRYIWGDVLDWMDSPEKKLLPPDPETLTGLQRTAFCQSHGSERDRAAYEGDTPALATLGEMAAAIKDEDEDPLAVEDAGAE
jgi:hypothetical protein